MVPMSALEQKLKEEIEAAKTFSQNEMDTEALAKYTEILQQQKKAKEPGEIFQIFRALINRGIVNYRLDKHEKSRGDWQAVIDWETGHDEWLDRAKIRALRNLAWLEDLPPPESPLIRRAFETYRNSLFPSVQKILWEASMNAPWPFDEDTRYLAMMRSWFGSKEDPRILSQVWCSLTLEERGYCRSWWGSLAADHEKALGKLLGQVGPAFPDESWFKPPAAPAFTIIFRKNEVGRGGIRSVFLSNEGEISWITSDGSWESPDKKLGPSGASRLWSYSPSMDRFAQIRDGRGKRIELRTKTNEEWLQPLYRPSALAWGKEIAWVDEKGFFCGKVQVTKRPLEGIVFWDNLFLAWDASAAFLVDEEGDVSPFPHKGKPDLVNVDGKRLQLVSGKIVKAYSRSPSGIQAEWSAELPWLPVMASVEGLLSAFSDGKAIVMYKKDQPVREISCSGVQTLAWCSGRLAVGDSEWAVRLYGIKPGEDSVLRFHRDWVNSMAWDKTRFKLYTASLDGSVACWNLAGNVLEKAWGQTHALELTATGEGWVSRGLAWFEPMEMEGTGASLISNGEILAGVIQRKDSVLALSAGGKLYSKSEWKPWLPPPVFGLINLGEKTWACKTGKIIEIETRKEVEFSQDGDWVNCSCEAGEGIFFAGTGHGKIAYRESSGWLFSEAWHEGPVTHIAWVDHLYSGPGAQTPGTLVTTGEDGKLFLWNPWKMTPVEVMKNDRKPLKGLVATARTVIGWDGGNVLRVWNLPGRGGYWEVGAHKGGVNCAVLSPDGFFVFSGGQEGEVRIWVLPGLESLGKVMHIGEPVVSLALRGKGELGVLGLSGAMNLVRWTLPGS